MKWSSSWDWICQTTISKVKNDLTCLTSRFHSCPFSCFFKCPNETKTGVRALQFCSRYETFITPQQKRWMLPVWINSSLKCSKSFAVLKCLTFVLCCKTWKPVSHITVCVCVYVYLCVCVCVCVRSPPKTPQKHFRLVCSHVFCIHTHTHTHILNLLRVNNHEHILFPRPILH